MSTVLLLYGERDIRYEERELPVIGAHDVHVRTRMGAISAGTEAAWYFGTDPQLHPSFRPGRISAAKFPKMLGYEKVADVIAVGDAVDSVQVGQRVVGHYGHTDEFVVPEARVVPVPDGISDEDAVACSLATVVIHGIRRARVQIGDDVFVTGLGFVGLLTVIIARLAGARRVVATDPVEKRRELALELGADAAMDPAGKRIRESLQDRFGPGLFDVAFETSASFEALHDAMTALRRNGRLCVLSQLKGDYPGHPLFGIEFHLEELEMISSDGRGDVHKMARWYFDAVARGAIGDLGKLITHRVPFREVGRGFELLETEPDEVVKILVTYDA